MAWEDMDDEERASFLADVAAAAIVGGLCLVAWVAWVAYQALA